MEKKSDSRGEMFNIEKLPTELLYRILYHAKHPKYFARLSQANSKFCSRLSQEHYSAGFYWKSIFQDDFLQEIPKEYIEPAKKIYQKFLVEGDSDKNLSDKHRNLFNNIRFGDIESIKRQEFDDEDIEKQKWHPLEDFYLTKNTDGENAISLAVQYHRNSLLQYFYDLAINNVQDEGTKIRWAALCNRVDEIQKLSIPKKFDISNHVNLYLRIRTQFETQLEFNEIHPIIFAAMYGHNEIVMRMIACFSEMQNKSNLIYALVWLAIDEGYFPIVKNLMALSQVDLTSDHTLIHPIVISSLKPGRVEILEFLVNGGLDLQEWFDEDDIKDIWMELPFAFETLKYVSDNGVSLPDKMTILHLAVLTLNVSILEIYLKKGADPNEVDANNRTAIFDAMNLDHFKAIKLLIQFGADCFHPDNNFYTPFHKAIHKCDFELVKMLIRKNLAKALIWKDHEGRNLLGIATRVFKGGVASTPENKNENIKIVKFLLAQGFNPNHVDDAGLTPIFYLTHNPIILKLLIENGADVKMRNKRGESILTAFLSRMSLEVLHILYDAGIDINEADQDGLTPIELAVCYKESDFVKYLLSKDADTNIITSTGLTLLELAKQESTDDIYQMMLGSVKPGFAMGTVG